jgi:hypothetical protein
VRGAVQHVLELKHAEEPGHGGMARRGKRSTRATRPAPGAFGALVGSMTSVNRVSVTFPGTPVRSAAALPSPLTVSLPSRSEKRHGDADDDEPALAAAAVQASGGGHGCGSGSYDDLGRGLIFRRRHWQSNDQGR